MKGKKLTHWEAMSIDQKFNLCDAHTYQQPSTPEMNQIFSQLSRFYEYGSQQRGSSLDREAFSNFLLASKQLSVSDDTWFLPTYAASISTEIVSHVLRRKVSIVHLVEPTFDNLYDIMIRNGLVVKPIRLEEGSSYHQSVIRLLNESSERVECVFLVLPNNPTGQNISVGEFADILNICKKNDVLVLIDACFRVFDYANIFDQHRLLQEAGVEYILIEDTGKIWPTLDLKLSFLCASPSLRGEIRNVYDDFLLNVSPFISVLVREYSKFEQLCCFSAMSRNISVNRVFLRGALAERKLSVRIPYPKSTISVELLEFTNPVMKSEAFCEYCMDRGVGILSASSFYWAQNEKGEDKIRIALARPEQYFRDAVSYMCDLLAEFIDEMSL